MSEQRGAGGPELWVRVLINAAGFLIVAGIIAIIVATIITELR